MKKQDLVHYVGKPILKPLTFIMAMLSLAFFASPFVWIWHTWDLAWKMFVTGLFGFLILQTFFKFVEQAVSKLVDEQLEIKTRKRERMSESMFQQKLSDKVSRKTYLNNGRYFHIEGKSYQKISRPSRPQVPSRTMKQIMDIAMIYGGVNLNQNKAPQANLIEEFELIQQKKSKLSRAERDRVVWEFLKHYRPIVA